MDFTAAIEEAKKLIKHLEENPDDLEKLNKGFPQKGVHNPANATFNQGNSKAGNTQRFGIAHVGMQNKSRVKAQHEKVIAEQKAMPKPNLPKNEMQKGDYFRNRLMGQKGVHAPASEQAAGKSAVGKDVRVASNLKLPTSRFGVKEQHQKVIAEQKAMPKPNLPKAELEKAKVDTGKSPSEKAGARRIRNDREIVGHPDVGNGQKIVGTPKMPVKKSAKDLCKDDWAPKFHKAAGGAKDLVKENWQPKFHKPAMEVKGVNKPAKTMNGTMPGVSEAHVAMAGMSNASGKDVHRKVIAEQKAMPKPNLPKNEMAKEELHTGQEILADAKAKSKEKSAKELSAQVKAAAKGSDTMEKSAKSLNDHNHESIKRHKKEGNSFHYEAHHPEGNKRRKPNWHSVEIKNKEGKLVHGFGAGEETSAIKEAKALAQEKKD